MAAEKRPEEWREEIALYALGSLTPEEAQRVTERVASGDEAAAAALRHSEQVVGAFGYAADGVRPPTGLRAKLFERIGAEQGSPAAVQPIAMALEGLAWKAEPNHPGVSFHWLRRDATNGTATVLVKIQPGAAFGTHLHRGGEDCLVLQGGFRDRRGEYRAGDFVYYEPGSIHHDLRALEGEDCILFVVAHGGAEMLPTETVH